LPSRRREGTSRGCVRTVGTFRIGSASLSASLTTASWGAPLGSI
jgi:hypothetical protein